MAFKGLRLDIVCAVCGSDLSLVKKDGAVNVFSIIEVQPCKKCSEEVDNLKSSMRKFIEGENL